MYRRKNIFSVFHFIWKKITLPHYFVPMKAKREESDHPWSRDRKINPVPEPTIKVRFYTVVYNDKPDVKHQISISQENNHYTYDVKFSKPLIHPVTKSPQTRDRISCGNLNELKSILRNFLSNFGEYKIKPMG
jgi:hypothetical protein